jgi:hypothetical protein
MAMYHLDIKSIKRSLGQSATGAAAYRAGERIQDERTGKVHNHSHRTDVTHTEIFLPSHFEATPMDWARDRAKLWNTAESAEKRRDSRVAREFEVSLPSELSAAQRLTLARNFAREISDRYAVAVDLAVHDPKPTGDPRHFHAHLLTTTREVTADGLGAKTGLDMGSLKRVQLGLSDHSEEYTAVRERWATVANGALKEANIEERVDHRTLSAQGIDRQPVVHLPMEFYNHQAAGLDKDVLKQIREQYRARVSARRSQATQREGIESSPVMETRDSAERRDVAEPQGSGKKLSQGSQQRGESANSTKELPQRSQQRVERATQPAQTVSREQSIRAEPQQVELPGTPESSVRAAPLTRRPKPTATAGPTGRAEPLTQQPGATATAEPAAAPRTVEEIRRRAVQNWLRMRSKEAESPGVTADRQRASGANSSRTAGEGLEK